MCATTTLVICAIVLTIVVLSALYMKEGFDYRHPRATYDGRNMLELPPIYPSWFDPRVDSHCDYCPRQSGMTDLPPGAIKGDGKLLTESYGVGYTDERGWYY